MSARRDLAAAVEELVDATSLHAVLRALAETAFAKADHLESNWQDSATARVWSRLGKRIDTVASAAEQAGI
jgi:hypothetical protein